jgi:hypothetical protein
VDRIGGPGHRPRAGPHVASILLELYPNAPIKEEMARARWSQAPDEVAAAMYLSRDGSARTRPATSSTKSRTSRVPAAGRGTT